jgi:hypothetical protein
MNAELGWPMVASHGGGFCRMYVSFVLTQLQKIVARALLVAIGLFICCNG